MTQPPYTEQDVDAGICAVQVATAEAFRSVTAEEVTRAVLGDLASRGRLRQPGDRPEWEVLREAADEVERDGGTTLTALWAADVLRERAAEAEDRAGRRP